jgi:hypothetical protein
MLTLECNIINFRRRTSVHCRVSPTNLVPFYVGQPAICGDRHVRASLRQAINDAVVQWVTTKLQSGQPVDVGFMAREITGSLIDMVLQQEEKHQGPLLHRG